PTLLTWWSNGVGSCGPRFPGGTGHHLHRGRICVSKRRFIPLAVVLPAIALVAALLAGTGGAAPKATFRAGLVSDVGRFNDKGFNQLQLVGLQRAKAKLHVDIQALESRSAGDYIPNFTTLARQGFNIISGAGFLLAQSEATVAKQFPSITFTITDASAP